MWLCLLLGGCFDGVLDDDSLDTDDTIVDSSDFVELDCDDELDNDGDGDTDCEDEDCASECGDSR